MSSRRNFIQQSVLGLAGTAVVPLLGSASLVKRDSPVAGLPALPIGIAGFTFAKFDVDQSIAMMKRLGVQNLSLKEFAA